MLAKFNFYLCCKIKSVLKIDFNEVFMKTVLYMHGGSGNHGCEALVRTTTKIAKDATGSDVILWSQNVSEDYKYGVSGVVDEIVATDEVNKKSLSFLWSYFKFKILKKAMLYINCL